MNTFHRVLVRHTVKQSWQQKSTTMQNITTDTIKVITLYNKGLTHVVANCSMLWVKADSSGVIKSLKKLAC